MGLTNMMLTSCMVSLLAMCCSSNWAVNESTEFTVGLDESEVKLSEELSITGDKPIVVGGEPARDKDGRTGGLHWVTGDCEHNSEVGDEFIRGVGLLNTSSEG